MKKLLFILSMVIVAFGVTSCLEPSSSQKMADKQEEQMQELVRQVGFPAIKNFQEKKLAKTIMELRDREDLICYAYIVNLQGSLIYLGKCIGYGLPYSTQYSNPMKAEYSHSLGKYLIPQAEPNGLYMPEGLSATWLMMLDKNGDPHPVYLEPEIIVSPFPLQ